MRFWLMQASCAMVGVTTATLSSVATASPNVFFIVSTPRSPSAQGCNLSQAEPEQNLKWASLVAASSLPERG
jgi:hypothetical protein